MSVGYPWIQLSVRPFSVKCPREKCSMQSRFLINRKRQRGWSKTPMETTSITDHILLADDWTVQALSRAQKRASSLWNWKTGLNTSSRSILNYWLQVWFKALKSQRTASTLSSMTWTMGWLWTCTTTHGRTIRTVKWWSLLSSGVSAKRRRKRREKSSKGKTMSMWPYLRLKLRKRLRRRSPERWWAVALEVGFRTW